MPSSSVKLSENDVVKLVLEFLDNRGLHISLLNVERETGIINGAFSDDMLFLRQLILNGQWDDVIDFIQPLSAVPTFDLRHFQYLIYKHKYLELLCIKGESAPMYEVTVDNVVTCLNSLEDLCPSKEDYSQLCLLLTLPRLSDHSAYQHWNPSSGRVECFRDVRPLIEKYLPLDRRDKRGSEDRQQMAKDDRLLQLLIKGLLYESCVDYCQRKATGGSGGDDMKISHLLKMARFSDADMSLLAWLQAVPGDIFTCPFEQKMLHVDMLPMEKPSLEATWSEQILVTPIKPKLFPHSAMPSGRTSAAAEMMSRSLNPQFDGLAFGLSTPRRDSSDAAVAISAMSRSFAGFHLSSGGGQERDVMHTSIDKLFEGSEQLNTHSSIIVDSLQPLPLPQTPSPRLSRTSTPVSKTTSPSRQQYEQEDTQSSQDLYKEYQKQRQLLKEHLEEQEKKRRMYQVSKSK